MSREWVHSNNTRLHVMDRLICDKGTCLCVCANPQHVCGEGPLSRRLPLALGAPLMNGSIHANSFGDATTLN